MTDEMEYEKKAAARVLRLLADLIEMGTYRFIGYEEMSVEPESISVDREPYDLMFSFIVNRPLNIFTESKNENQ